MEAETILSSKKTVLTPGFVICRLKTFIENINWKHWYIENNQIIRNKIMRKKQDYEIGKKAHWKHSIEIRNKIPRLETYCFIYTRI